MALPTKVQLVDIDAAQAGQRVDNFLLTRLKGVPKSRIYRLLRKGEVRVNKKRIKPIYRLQAGDQLRIPPVRIAQEGEPVPIPGWVNPALQPALHEDDALLVVNKPPGLAVHAGSGLAFGVIEALRDAHPKWPFIELVHRLDRETSGVLILAKTRAALLAVQTQLRREEGAKVAKAYIAILAGPPLEQPQTVTARLQQSHNAQGKKTHARDD